MSREEQSLWEIMSPFFQERNEKAKSLKRLGFLIAANQGVHKNGVLKNFAKFTEFKCLCQSHFLNKVAGLRAATLLKKRLPVNFTNFFRTPFFQ